MRGRRDTAGGDDIPEGRGAFPAANRAAGRAAPPEERGRPGDRQVPSDLAAGAGVPRPSEAPDAERPDEDDLFGDLYMDFDEAGPPLGAAPARAAAADAGPGRLIATEPAPDPAPATEPAPAAAPDPAPAPSSAAEAGPAPSTPGPERAPGASAPPVRSSDSARTPAPVAPPAGAPAPPSVPPPPAPAPLRAEAPPAPADPPPGDGAGAPTALLSVPFPAGPGPDAADGAADGVDGGIGGPYAPHEPRPAVPAAGGHPGRGRGGPGGRAAPADAAARAAGEAGEAGGPSDADEEVAETSRSDSLGRAPAAEPDAHPTWIQATAWSAASHPGSRRAARRERLGLGPQLTARDNDDRYAATGEVFVVADGLGGHPAGWFAADVAVRSLVAELASADLRAGWSDRLRAAVAVADRAVRAHAVGDAYEGMRTTVVAAVVQGGRLHLAGCGDSVCWLVRGGRAFRLTEQGNAARFGRPWLLTSTPLGGSDLPDPELLRVELRAGDRIVLATDGVAHLPDETVADLVQGDPFHAATTLTISAVRSGDDDATAVVVECAELPRPLAEVDVPGSDNADEDAPVGR